MTLSTHVLDLASGTAVAGLPFRVEHLEPGGWWSTLATLRTGADGRAADLVPTSEWGPGRWRLVFDTAAHLGADAFLPSVTIEFAPASSDHHHVPLLLSPFGFSTYRGT
jgi:5-hydroxyisourate hydrolase